MPWHSMASIELAYFFYFFYSKILFSIQLHKSFVRICQYWMFTVIMHAHFPFLHSVLHLVMLIFKNTDEYNP